VNKIIGYIVAILLFSLPSLAQTVPPDVFITPNTATISWKVQTAASGGSPEFIGVAPCGVAPTTKTDFVAFVDLLPPSVGVIVNGNLPVSLSADSCFEAYAGAVVGTVERFSPPSPNKLVVQVYPLAPTIVP